MSPFSALLRQEFLPYGGLSDVQLSHLESHYELLLRWNRKINLTRITELQDAVRMHYCESLYAAREIPADIKTVADIGSGAGFPGIPVAVFRPEISVTLVESDQRKAVFLREASRNLSNVTVLAQRAEDLQGQFDMLVSRAVRPEEVLTLKVSGRFLILGSEGEALPWGERRFLLRVGW